MIGARRDPHKRRVSVVIPCYNGERYIADTIRSVLRQKHESLEIIVVDDGSTDGSRSVVASFHGDVVYLQQPHAGANGPVPMVRALTQSLNLATVNLGMTVGLMEQFVSPELPDGAKAGFRFSPDPVPARMCGTVLMRRSEFDRVGALSPQLVSGEFTDWILRAETAGVTFATVPELVLRRRLHLMNHGVVRRDARQDYVKVVKAALDRRRAAAAPEGQA